MSVKRLFSLNEIKDVRPSQPEEELECLSRLAVRNVPGGMSIGAFRTCHANAHSSARHSIRIGASGALETTFDDDCALSNSNSRATMTEGMS